MNITKTKKAAILICFAIAAELVMLTDWAAMRISEAISSNEILQGVIAFLLIYMFWITGITIIRKVYKRNTAIHFSNAEKPNKTQWLVALLLLAVSVVTGCISWSGFKVYKELTNAIAYVGTGLGIANFIAQYFYYFLEVILMIIILAFAQEAGETLFKPRWIPYGGIVLALLWGLVHIAFHGVADGLTTTFTAVLYGSAFLVLRKNVKSSFWLVFLMFVC